MTKADLPAPLVPADCDLSDFAFMPLDVARLRDSELASNETPEACWAAVLLWAASWHQVPAASIPNDDKWIAKQAGYAQRGKIAREWSDVRSGALRGWVACSDGRLYHPVVAEKARDAWQAKIEQRYRTEMARIKKHNERHDTTIPRVTFEEWVSQGCPQGQPLPVARDKPPETGDIPGDKASKGQGEGQGQGDLSSVPNGTDGASLPAAGDAAQKKPKTPEDIAKAELWRNAVLVLQEGGCKAESMCRSFMGKLVLDYTYDVVKEAVTAAVSAQPAEAREYLKAACQRIVGERKKRDESAVTVPSQEADKTAAYLATQALSDEEIHIERLQKRLAGNAPAAAPMRRVREG